MRLLGKLLADVTPKDIQTLIENKQGESVDLEYKRDLPSNNDNGKKEFLSDVTSFANTQGGTIIFGIEDEKDINGKNTGKPKIVGITSNEDQEKLRLENIIRDGLDPKLSNIQFQLIEIEGKKLLLLGIPRSLFAPHIVWFQKSGKFYARNSAGKFQMDVREMRQAFLQGDSWEANANNFRRERIMSVRSLEVIPNLDIEGSYFLHILPLGSQRSNIDLRQYENDLRLKFNPVFSGGWDSQYNLDGFITESGGDNIVQSYTQIFRNGGIEIYTSLMHFKKEKGDGYSLDAQMMEGTTIGQIKRYLEFCPEMGVEPPLVIYLTLLDLRGGKISFERQRLWASSHFERNLFTKNELFMPGLLIDDLGVDVPKLLESTFNTIWQAAGMKESLTQKKPSQE